jgi:GGDEF domain-containing protein
MLSKDGQRVASLSRPSLAFLLLNLLLLGSWAWLAQDRLPLPLVVGVALLAAAGEFYLSRDPAASEAFARREHLASLFARAPAARRNALTDEATGLYNRWYLEKRLEEEAARCRRFDLSMAVIVVRTGVVEIADMSNDSWQAASADAAQRCLRIVRSVDIGGFLGPLEFAICFVHCTRAGAEAAAGRIRQELFDYAPQFGVALYPDDNCEPRALVDCARLRSRSAATLARAA